MTLTLNPEPLDRTIDGMAFTFEPSGPAAYTTSANGNCIGRIKYQGGWLAASYKAPAVNGKRDEVGPFKSMEDACRFLAREAMGPVGNATQIDGRKPMEGRVR